MHDFDIAVVIIGRVELTRIILLPIRDLYYAWHCSKSVGPPYGQISNSGICFDILYFTAPTWRPMGIHTYNWAYNPTYNFPKRAYGGLPQL